MFFMMPGNSSFFVEGHLRQRRCFLRAQAIGAVFFHARVILFPMQPEGTGSLRARRSGIL